MELLLRLNLKAWLGNKLWPSLSLEYMEIIYLEPKTKDGGRVLGDFDLRLAGWESCPIEYP